MDSNNFVDDTKYPFNHEWFKLKDKNKRTNPLTKEQAIEILETCVKIAIWSGFNRECDENYDPDKICEYARNYKFFSTEQLLYALMLGRDALEESLEEENKNESNV